MADDFASLMQSMDSSPKRSAKLSRGDVVEGTVIQIASDCVFVDVGLPAEARLARGEVMNKDGTLRVAVGQKLRATLIDVNPDSPRLVLALGRGGNADQGLLRIAFETGAPVEGKVDKAVKGGLEVDLNGVRAFCPASQIDTTFIADLEPFVGQTYEFLITKLEDRNAVVSRRALLDKQRKDREKSLRESLTVGAEMDGTVTSTSQHGAVIDVGGLEGFVHISELTYGRVDRVDDVVKAGEGVRVKLLSMEESPRGLRLRLSMKALLDAPKPVQADKNEIYEGTVTRASSFGVFVQTKIGEGLIPMRDLGLPPTADHRRAVPVGKVLRVVLTNKEPNGKLRFSATGVEAVEERQNYSAFTKGSGTAEAPTSGFGSLGDLLRKKLNLPESAPVASAPAAAAAAEVAAPKASPKPGGAKAAPAPTPVADRSAGAVHRRR